MNSDNSNPNQGPSKKAVAVILIAVCALSGWYPCIQMAKIFPGWLAVLITLGVGIVLVRSLAESLGNDLLDIVIGCVVVIIIMVMLFPIAKQFSRHPPATGRESSIVK